MQVTRLWSQRRSTFTAKIRLMQAAVLIGPVTRGSDPPASRSRLRPPTIALQARGVEEVHLAEVGDEVRSALGRKLPHLLAKHRRGIGIDLAGHLKDGEVADRLDVCPGGTRACPRKPLTESNPSLRAPAQRAAVLVGGQSLAVPSLCRAEIGILVNGPRTNPQADLEFQLSG